jgi:uncharacterized protein with PIN domain
MRKFIADAMLGNLCRWLRILGYDTFFGKGMDDTSLLNLAIDEKRALLTSDRELFLRAKGAIRAVLIFEKGTEKQLEKVFRELKINPVFPPKKPICPLCNSRLKNKGEKRWECSCKKEYWEGSHWKKIQERVRRIREALKP